MIRLSENNLLPKLQYRITFTQSHYDKFSCLFIFWTVQPELFAPWVKFTNSLTFLGYTPLFMARGKHTKSTQTINCYWKSLLLKNTKYMNCTVYIQYSYLCTQFTIVRIHTRPYRKFNRNDCSSKKLQFILHTVLDKKKQFFKSTSYSTFL